MDDFAYGLWPVVAIDSAILLAFAVSFFRPRTARDWRAMGAFSAFVVALFTEMYGFPLTIYLLSGWLGSRFPGLTLTHSGGHLWNDLIGWTGDPHLSPFHIASYVLMIGGLWLIRAAWRVLWLAQRGGGLAVTGPYAWVRHPQYAGFFLIMVGLLAQWPTLPTLLMFPVLVIAYRRLAAGEERETRETFGPEWDAYAARKPRFIPRHARLAAAGTHS
ncbi:MAG: isoprenylcysteine carboxylmethyltransferase family protein [Elusimicrobia bacterium]|nr:isoprenylcysteine carboxylmethyltransferase family protein [Elusimicrobiota bacterium]